MAIGIYDLDDDDFGSEIETQQPEVNVQLQPQVEEPSVNQEDNFLDEFLKTRGIEDSSRIKFEDENNLIVERSWNDLTKEEKFNILNTPLENVKEDNNDLTEEEINLLNTIRQQNLTPTQYIQLIQNQQVTLEPTYKIDDLSDDELFILDLESRVGEISDEVAAEALNNAKQNEELYKKLVEGIRKEYKDREDFLMLQEQATIEQEQQEAYNRYLDNIINSINEFNNIGNLDLNFSDSDKEELAEFMLSKDESGNNYLYQALQDPDTLVKAAWFILNGNEALDSISEYFVNLIKLVSENLYKKGFEDGKKGVSTRPTVVIDNSKRNQNRQTYNSINDLDDDD